MLSGLLRTLYIISACKTDLLSFITARLLFSPLFSSPQLCHFSGLLQCLSFPFSPLQSSLPFSSPLLSSLPFSCPLLPLPSHAVIHCDSDCSFRQLPLRQPWPRFHQIIPLTSLFGVCVCLCVCMPAKGCECVTKRQHLTDAMIQKPLCS